MGKYYKLKGSFKINVPTLDIEIPKINDNPDKNSDPISWQCFYVEASMMNPLDNPFYKCKKTASLHGIDKKSYYSTPPPHHFTSKLAIALDFIKLII